MKASYPKLVTLTVTFLILLSPTGGEASSIQVPGYAEITFPQPNEALMGLVTILGTATHPTFIAYDLSFAYNRDGTETWFPIGDRLTVPVSDGRLAIWDTTGITDGDYILRLRVWYAEDRALTTVVPGVRIRNYSPLETDLPGAEAEVFPAAESSPTPTPFAARLERVTPPRVEVGGEPKIVRAFLFGAGGALVAMLILGLYTRARGLMTTYIAEMRMRHFHWRTDRSRRSRASRPRRRR